jgi:hypothetical protein
LRTHARSFVQHGAPIATDNESTSGAREINKIRGCDHEERPTRKRRRQHCSTGGWPLRKWVRQAERDSGQRGGLTTDERQRFKDLERENRELKRANEILQTASAYFAKAALDRRPK